MKQSVVGSPRGGNVIGVGPDPLFRVGGPRGSDEAELSAGVGRGGALPRGSGERGGVPRGGNTIDVGPDPPLLLALGRWTAEVG